MAFQCAAVSTVSHQPNRRVLLVKLTAGNDPQWVQPILDQVLTVWKRDSQNCASHFAPKIRAVADDTGR